MNPIKNQGSSRVAGVWHIGANARAREASIAPKAATACYLLPEGTEELAIILKDAGDPAGRPIEVRWRQAIKVLLRHFRLRAEWPDSSQENHHD